LWRRRRRREIKILEHQNISEEGKIKPGR